MAKDKLVPVGSEEIEKLDEIPGFMQRTEVPLGAEHITNEDARIPRLSLAQGLSHQMTPEDPLYIDGLKLGHAFNDLTEEIYGNGKIQALIVRADPPRWVEFDEDRSVIDPRVPAGDPRTEFTTDEKTGERLPPRATKFYDYVILMAPNWDPIALSFSKSGIKSAMRLNGLIRTKPTVPVYGCYYEFTPAFQKNDQGTWYIFTVRQAGYVRDEAIYKRAESAFKLFKTKEVEFERQPGDDNPNEM
jgi:hypothetical protein